MKHPILSRTFRLLLAAFAIITALKILLVGYDIDEQYAIAMSYRLLRGDFPVRDMWEPHQTSGFAAALLMAPYLALTKSASGIVLYLRCCGLAIHSLTAFLFYRQAKAILAGCASPSQALPGAISRDSAPKISRDIAMLLSCIYFFSLPKLMFAPEFSNMQLWFLLLMMLCMSHYYHTPVSPKRKASVLWLFGAGCFLALEVLSYPSTLLLFPICLYGICTRPLPAKGLCAFCAPCVGGAMLFLGCLLARMSPGELFSLLPLIAGDGSHSAPLGERLLANALSLRELFSFFAAYALIALTACLLLQGRLLSGTRGASTALPQRIPRRLLWGICLVMAALLGQVLIWLFGNRYPNYPLAEYFFVPALALVGIPRKEASEKSFFFLFVALPLAAFAGIVLFTNHPLLVSAPFLGICTAGALLGACLFWKEWLPVLRIALTAWVFVLLFGKCYMVRTTGGLHYTLLHPISIMREGPAAGILADRETVRQYNASLELLKECVPPSSKALYLGVSNGIYLMRNLEVCSPSTISSPTFDGKLEQYFSMRPEKTPEYVICDANLAALEGDGFLPRFLRERCEPEAVAANDFLIIYQVRSFSHTGRTSARPPQT